MRYEYNLETGVMTEHEDLPASIVPEKKITSVSMRQARLALLQAGFLPAIDAEMSSDEQKIWWDYSPTVERDNSFVIQVTAKLGISEAQVDDLFTLASTL